MSAEPITTEFEAGWDNRLYLLPPGAIREPQVRSWIGRLRSSEGWQLVALELKAVGALAVAAAVVAGAQQIPVLIERLGGLL